MTMRAYLKNYRQAPRKVRLVADAIRGKRVSVVQTELAFMPHKAAAMFKKLVQSAVANARQNDASVDAKDLVIDRVTVDKGITYVRYMPRAFGRATPINRECSHVSLVLAPAVSEDREATAAPKKTAEKMAEKKEVKEAAPKKAAQKVAKKTAPKKAAQK